MKRIRKFLNEEVTLRFWQLWLIIMFTPIVADFIKWVLRGLIQ